jgi:hypothetical protein
MGRWFNNPDAEVGELRDQWFRPATIGVARPLPLAARLYLRQQLASADFGECWAGSSGLASILEAEAAARAAASPLRFASQTAASTLSSGSVLSLVDKSWQ